jgi:hypothetical protein
VQLDGQGPATAVGERQREADHRVFGDVGSDGHFVGRPLEIVQSAAASDVGGGGYLDANALRRVK